MTCPNCGNPIPEEMKFCPKCGTPTEGSRYSPPVNPAPPVWQANAPTPPIKQKSRAGKILLIVGIVVLLLAGGIGVAIYFGVSSYIRSTKSSAAYALAESTLRSSKAVKERMGEITNIGIPIGTTHEGDDGTGYAAFTMSLVGEKESGQYVVVMDRRNSSWRIQNAVVKLRSGEEIKIIDIKDRIYSDEPPGTETDANEDTGTSDSNNSNQKSRIVSGGVLNGKATSLPQPVYPAAAKAAKAAGAVVVEVTIDEDGKVISASAVSGHPLLRASAVTAARQARFSPTKLAGKPVKVSGVLNYNFELEP